MADDDVREQASHAAWQRCYLQDAPYHDGERAFCEGFEAGADWQREQDLTPLSEDDGWAILRDGIAAAGELHADCRARADALRAQVATLREALEENKFFDEASGKDDDLCRYCMSTVNNHAADCVLADTDPAEPAARYQREQRLEGARELVERLKRSGWSSWSASFALVLAEMESEA